MEHAQEILDALQDIKATLEELKGLLRGPDGNLYQEFLDLYNKVFSKRFRGDAKSKRQFHARMKEGRTLEEFEKAMKAMFQDEYHSTTVPPFKYTTPEFVTRADKLDRFLNQYTEPRKPIKSTGYHEL